MADEQTPTDPLADLIAAHRLSVMRNSKMPTSADICTCEWIGLDHAAHVAAVVRASGTTTEVTYRPTQRAVENVAVAYLLTIAEQAEEIERLRAFIEALPAVSGVTLGGTTREDVAHAIIEADDEFADTSADYNENARRWALHLADAVLALRPVPAPDDPFATVRVIDGVRYAKGDDEWIEVPAPDDQQTEVERLRAENEYLRHDYAGALLDVAELRKARAAGEVHYEQVAAERDAARADLAALRDGAREAESILFAATQSAWTDEVRETLLWDGLTKVRALLAGHPTPGVNQ